MPLIYWKQCQRELTTEFSKSIKENWPNFPQYILSIEIEEKLRCLILIDIFTGFRISMKQAFGQVCEGVSRLGYLC